MSNIIINFIQEEILNSDEDFTVTADEDLLASGLLDSLAVMKLIQFIEKTYELKIPPEDMTIENFISVEAMETYLEQLKSK